MPKTSKYPRLRVYVKRGKAGQVWTSYAYDMRGTGNPDVPLGADYAAALARWAELSTGGPRLSGTLEEAFAGWEADGITHRLDGTPRKPVTLADYRKALEALRKPFGGARWEDVTLPVLAAYVRKRSAKTRARHEMQVLSVIWAWARVRGLTALEWPALGMQHSGWMGQAKARQRVMGTDEFEAIYAAADQVLRDYMDIATATALRGPDVCGLSLNGARDGWLRADSGKTGKSADFELAGSILAPLIERRLTMRKPEHLFLLADASRKRPVSYRAVLERFNMAREAAAKLLPSCADVWLSDMRKRGAQLAPDLQAASKLLQHSSLSVTRKHYRGGDKIKPVR